MKHEKQMYLATSRLFARSFILLNILGRHTCLNLTDANSEKYEPDDCSIEIVGKLVTHVQKVIDRQCVALISFQPLSLWLPQAMATPPGCCEQRSHGKTVVP